MAWNVCSCSSEGGAYFAHAGQWIKLANDSQIVPDTNTTYSQHAVGATGGVNLRLTSSGGTNDDITITAGLNISIDNIGSNGFRINSTAWIWWWCYCNHR